MNDHVEDVVQGTLLACEQNGWMQAIHQLVRDSEYQSFEKKYTLLVWKKSDLVSFKNAFFWVDAVAVGKIFIGAGRQRTFVSLNSQRLFFFLDNTERPVPLKQLTNLHSSALPLSNQQKVLNTIVSFKQFLLESGQFKIVKHQTKEQDCQLDQISYGLGYADSCFTFSKDLWLSMSQNGAFYVPEKIEVRVVCDKQHLYKVNQYIAELEKKFYSIVREGQQCRFVKTQLDKALQFAVQRLEEGGQNTINHRIFLIAVSGQRGEPLPEKQQQLMEVLDQLKQPYRLFSYDNANLRFSAAQILSLLDGAGGQSYRLVLPVPREFEQGAFFGVDLGHNFSTKQSKLVVSVLDANSRHIVSVRVQTSLNEASDSASLRKVLIKAKELAEQQMGSEIKQALIVRDGRIPMKKDISFKEDKSVYLNCLDIPVTVVELIKNKNPVIFERSADKPRVSVGHIYRPCNSRVQFFTAYSTAYGLPRTFKVHIPKHADQMGWGLDGTTKVLAGLCYAPSLGTQPHIPGPVYWADGFANTSETDNRFSGQNVVDLKMKGEK